MRNDELDFPAVRPFLSLDSHCCPDVALEEGWCVCLCLEARNKMSGEEQTSYKNTPRPNE